jgi:hypothetical protein
MKYTLESRVAVEVHVKQRAHGASHVGMGKPR